MGRFDGKVVLITGGARGQGRSPAVKFAQEGADVEAADKRLGTSCSSPTSPSRRARTPPRPARA
jgi:hypothetical protein